MSDEGRIEVDTVGIWIWYKGDPIKFIGVRKLNLLIQQIEDLRTSCQTPNAIPKEVNQFE